MYGGSYVRSAPSGSRGRGGVWRSASARGWHTGPMNDLRIPPGPGCPGGQGVNTADSRVQLSLDLGSTRALNEKQRERALRELGERLVGTVLTVTAAETRSQRRNRAAARERLGEILRASLVPPTPRRPTKPTRASKLRRLDAKKRRSEVKARRRRPDAD